MANKKIFGDFDTGNTFTVYHTKSNNGENKFRIGATDNGCFFESFILLYGMILVLFEVIISPYRIYQFIKEKREEKELYKKIRQYNKNNNN